MKPGRFDLPPIWRGLDYPVITLKWKDQDGNPFDLSDYQVFSKTQDFDLDAQVTDASNGVTTISLAHLNTSSLRLGKRYWDWVFKKISTNYFWPPFLMGTVEVKQTLSKPT